MLLNTPKGNDSTLKTGTKNTSNSILPLISIKEVVEKIHSEEEIVLLDCRNDNEFSQTHIKQAVLLNNNPMMVKRFLRGTKQLSDLLLVSQNANDIVKKMENKLSIFYDSSTIQGSMKDIIQNLITKKNLKIKAMEGGFQEFSTSFQDLCTDAAQESNGDKDSNGENLRQYSNVISTAEWEKAPPAKILPHLVLGNVYDSENKTTLQNLNIGHIINVSEHIPFKFEKDFQYLRVPSKDNTGANLSIHFNKAFDFIEKARTAGSVVFIHCHAGISRSVSITIAYMIKYYKMGLYQAYNFIKARRSCVAPNLNFMGQLLAFEKQVREEELKTPVQHKQIEVLNQEASFSLVSKLITIPSVIFNSSAEEEYATMDETPKSEETINVPVFESIEKNPVPKKNIFTPPQYSQYAPGSLYQGNQVFLSQNEWNDLEIVGKSIFAKQDTPHPMTGLRRNSVAQIVNTFEHQLQTATISNIDIH